MPKFYNFVTRNALVSFLAVIWGMAMASYATYQLFNDISLITLEANAAYATLMGLPALTFGIWKWRRGLNHGSGDGA